MDALPDDFFMNSLAFTPRVHREPYPAIDPTSPSLALAGRVVIVSGVTKGIGRRGIVPAFAKARPKAMVLVARSRDGATAVADELSQMYPDTEFVGIAADVSKDEDVASLFQQVSSLFGQADILVNNAGVNSAGGLLADVATATWWSDFETNAKGLFLMCQTFLKHADPTQPSTIINLSTSGAPAVFPGMSAYTLAKLVGLQMTAYIAAEYANTTAVALHPGVVRTDMVVPSFVRFAKDSPDLVGSTAVYLCSEQARWLSGCFVNANWNMEDLAKRREEV
ncbi:uncharacterized protein LTR77_011184 [Saxophila tyrrhenica]|uniref:Uncharacterized protein n=1 Tax=Saxophila tyrrhenica TaxID=1690608 RepID=A0AAV9NTL4_9PEZI|nr:hypothetical protein LTR77_011184 [Saxophila tyrrhenica]